MEVHKNFDQLPFFKNAVITVGTFDGVHRGHQQLIRRINSLAHEMEGESVMITFDPHPRTVVFPQDHSLKILSTLEEKIFLLNQFNIDHLVVMPFTKEFSRLSATQYVRKFLVEKFHPAIVVIGYNHQFGHHRDGNIELLRKLSKENNFRVEEITKQLVEDIEVSSTRIRIALQEGDVKTAAHLLGHLYSVEGTVVKGNQLGSRIGYPTANISVHDGYKLIPADGIYAIKATLDGNIYNGVISIGLRPTVNGKDRTIEAFLFDFTQDIYGKLLKVEFAEWIREERKFETIGLMTEAIRNDEEQAKQILDKVSK
ncbi:MAG: bifunctional riboflavin kinase/FAD synthetase [Chitinophagales bacterium]|nr:bifunctional riboflavin kinase/FAD synthetase [Chitinophagales bacterium]